MDLSPVERILHPQFITEMYREEASKYFVNPFLEFYSSQTKNYSGDRFEFAYRSITRDPAPANFRGQPARVLQPTGLSDRKIFMLHAFNEIGLSADALQMIRDPENTYLQEKGRKEIQDQAEDFGDRHLIFRAVCMAKTFVDGEVSFNQNGDILESSSGAHYTVDFGVPDSHRDQITGASDSFSGDIIANSWDEEDSSAETTTYIADIEKQLTDLDEAAEEANIEKPTHIWAHPSIKNYLHKNSYVQKYLQASPREAEDRLRGGMIEDLFGKTWHFFGGTYKAVDGTQKPYIPKTKLVITPDVGPWLRAANGSELITPYEGLTNGIMEAVNKLVEVYGDFAYAKLIDNPTKLVLRMGTNFVYAFANPNAVWAPEVIFT